MPQMKSMNWLNLLMYFMMFNLMILSNLNFYSYKKKMLLILLMIM